MRSWKPGPPQDGLTSSSAYSAVVSSFLSSRKRRLHERAAPKTSPPLPWKTDHRRGHRWVRQKHAIAIAAQVAGVKRPPSLLHGMELLGAGQRYNQTGKEEQEPDTDDVQPVARDRLCEPPLSWNSAPAQSRHDRLGRPLHVHGLRA